MSIAKQSLVVALPVMAGYVAIGIPCGILESQIGIDPVMAFVLSATFYSGAGQFMECNMWMAGMPLASIIASVSFVNTRQMLYSAAFSPYFAKVNRGLTFLFSATVTDESFGVNLSRFAANDGWTPTNALLVNLFCMLAWATSDAAGALVGGAVSIPTAIASYAMTAIFICLLVTQRVDSTNVLVAGVSAACVIVCKVVGLTGPAILLGACAGVAAGLVFKVARHR